MFVIQIFLIIFPILTSPKRLKIVNGTNADCSEFPFMVSLQNNSFHACGATILNRRFAMTAAHCVCNVISVDLKIYITHSLRSLGVPSERLIPVQSVICNDYSSIKHTNDIALLRLNYSIPLDLYHPVKMPPRNFETLENGEGILLGWGLVATNGNQPEILQKVSVMVYNDTICDESYYGIYDMKNNVCAGWPANGKGSCQGDSGGPLLVNGFQAGIISFGRSGDCGISNEETPKVLTRVSKYLDWIEQNSYWEEGGGKDSCRVSSVLTISLFVINIFKFL